MSQDCLLCGSGTREIEGSMDRPYLHCDSCRLIFVPKEHHLSPQEERLVYDQHQNDPLDLDYQRFLNRLMMPLLSHLTRGQIGLDYGSGPGPTLAIMLKGKGLECDIFDPIYNPDTELRESYDFITSTEVFEHFSDPKAELERLLDLLNPGGILGVMTSFHHGEEGFKNWHYQRDPTHVAFYASETFSWIAEKYGLESSFYGESVVIFRKPD